MENIKKLETEQDFKLLNENFAKILDEEVYDNGRDWTQEEVNLFVSQFNGIQDGIEEDINIDMNKLDPNFVSQAEYKAKFGGFDDDTLNYLCELENKKLEDARIPPLTVKNENITITDNLSNIIYNDRKENSEPKPKSNTDSQDSIGGLKTEAEEEEEEVAV